MAASKHTIRILPPRKNFELVEEDMPKLRSRTMLEVFCVASKIAVPIYDLYCIRNCHTGQAIAWKAAVAVEDIAYTDSQWHWSTPDLMQIYDPRVIENALDRVAQVALEELGWATSPGAARDEQTPTALVSRRSMKEEMVSLDAILVGKLERLQFSYVVA